MEMLVTVPAQGSLAVLTVNGQDFPCLIGCAGAIDASRKMEGDGKTPLGRWRVLYGMYRPDRVTKPLGGLLWRQIRQDDGWCDDAHDPLYNQLVPAGYPASHERLWRQDEAYDYLLVLDHNQPAQSGFGSAIFVHVWRYGAVQTEGCVALKPEVMAQLVGDLGMECWVRIV